MTHTIPTRPDLPSQRQPGDDWARARDVARDWVDQLQVGDEVDRETWFACQDDALYDAIGSALHERDMDLVDQGGDLRVCWLVPMGDR